MILRQKPETRPEKQDESVSALISNEQLCISWRILQVCALIKTRLPDELQKAFSVAASDLKATDAMAISLAVPGIEGRTASEGCAKAIAELRYTDCQADVLIAPPIQPGSGVVTEPMPTDPKISTGMIWALETLQGGVYKDPKLTGAVGELKQGVYLLQGIVFADDPVVGVVVSADKTITRSRIGLGTKLGVVPDTYIGGTHGDQLIGKVLNAATEPVKNPEIVLGCWHIPGTSWCGCIFKCNNCCKW